MTELFAKTLNTLRCTASMQKLAIQKAQLNTELDLQQLRMAYGMPILYI